MAFRARRLFFLLIHVLYLYSIESQKLLVIYMDGMRWDYVERYLSQPQVDSKTSIPSDGFHLFKDNGVFVERLHSVTPTHCLPNIYTAFTGRYPRYHGIFADKMYDASADFFFNFHGRDTSNLVSNFRASPKYWWNHTEPLWDTMASKYGKRSSVYYLPLAKELQGIRSRTRTSDGYVDSFSYKRIISWNDFVNRTLTAIGKLRRNQIDLAVVYNNILDYHGHNSGPMSDDVDNTMRRLDRLLGTIIREVMLEINKHIHVMVLSDHGMQEIAEKNRIFLDYFIMRSKIKKVVNGGSTVAIWPKTDSFDDVRSRLITVQDSGNVPYKVVKADEKTIDPRMPPILLAAKPGHLFISKEFPFPRIDSTGGNDPQVGYHGYLNSEKDMYTPMFVYGSKIRHEVHIKTMNVIEIYQLMCHILEITPQPNNGTFKHLTPLLKAYKQSQTRHMLRKKAHTNSNAQTLSNNVSLLTVVLLVVQVCLSY